MAIVIAVEGIGCTGRPEAKPQLGRGRRGKECEKHGKKKLPEGKRKKN